MTHHRALLPAMTCCHMRQAMVCTLIVSAFIAGSFHAQRSEHGLQVKILTYVSYVSFSVFGVLTILSVRLPPPSPKPSWHTGDNVARRLRHDAHGAHPARRQRGRTAH
jgi:hypothetical protein